jgi:hypothetical protein
MAIFKLRCASAQGTLPLRRFGFGSKHTAGDCVEAPGKGAGVRLDHTTDFRSYIIQRFAITWLVLFFESYDKTAQTGLGMLFCVNNGAEDGAFRWVMDVRLPCPTRPAVAGWQAAAIIMGSVLLLVCLCMPVFLARWLCTRAYKGLLTPEGEIEDEGASSWSGAGKLCRPWRQSLSNVLTFRYADYDVQYELLRQRNGSIHGKLASRVAGGASSFDRFQLWSVLVWDSILDMHRFLLAIAALCVMLHEQHQLLLVIMVFSSYLALILAVKPYRCTTIWRLQVLALATLLLSCFGILACNIGDTSSFYDGAVKNSYMKVIPWLIVALNVVYLFLAMAVLLLSVLHKCGFRIRRETATGCDCCKGNAAA